VEAALPLAFGYLLVLFRCAALCTVVPGFSAKTVPARIRLAAATLFAFAAWLGAGSPAVPVPSSLTVLFLFAGRETLYGAIGGLGARWVLEAATATGHIAGLSMGLGYGAQISPITGADSPAVGQLVSILALAGAVALGLHRETVLWLCRSLAIAPLGSGAGMHDLAARALAQGIAGLGLGARAAFPLLVAVISGHLALGLTSRFAQQINLHSIGFSVALLAGGAALYFFGPGAAELIARETVTALAG
jgi:flagellar biosynthesis protein FliR